ncbi:MULTISPECIES: heavy-metal-associated domain-containing protein [unclassified Cytobacillus]|uniref:heavy-metal-associated domain-containing protein n=1 Tax=unclassified Cytobacillus TaxID=2675268 RepID=UPI00135B8BD6|nr:cation transporter [Cytobacillus sp. AMY 15.2]KAF0815526.1 mercuric ion-binding protein [Bacillus sp. ZZV12-4809]MCM3091151.1 cation transporter [Cytobacillus sp. AMY 15.2]
MEKVSLKVVGMTCSHCEEAVKNALLSIDGVASVAIAFHDDYAEIEYDPEKSDMENLKQAIEDQGYGVA